MIRIEIKNAAVASRQVTRRATGEVFTFHSQEGWAFTHDKNGNPHPYPVRCEVPVDDPNKPYPVGSYQPRPDSLYVGRFNKLTLALRLVPIKAA